MTTIIRSFWQNMYRWRDKSGSGAGTGALGLGFRTCTAISHSGPLCPGCRIANPIVPRFLNPVSREGFLSRCYRKIRELALKSQKPKKFYLIVNKAVNRFLIARSRKMRGEKMKDSLAMLLKTNGGKMSVLASLAMLLKKQLVITCLSRY